MLHSTRVQLLEYRSATLAAVPRCTRKVLFTFRLWRPRSMRMHTHLSRSANVQVKVSDQEQQCRLHARQLRLATLCADVISRRRRGSTLTAPLLNGAPGCLSAATVAHVRQLIDAYGSTRFVINTNSTPASRTVTGRTKSPVVVATQPSCGGTCLQFFVSRRRRRLLLMVLVLTGSHSQPPGLLQRRISRAASGSVQSPPVCSPGRHPTRPRLTRPCNR